MAELGNKDITSDHLEQSAAQDEKGKLASVPIAERIQQQHADLYYEALEKYGHDGSIDPIAEKSLKR